MALVDKLILPDSVVLDPNFYVLMDSHVDFFRKHPNTQAIAIPGQQAEKYRGDFTGLLDSQSIDKKYHYLIMRVNGWSSSQEYDGATLSFLLPDTTLMARVIMTYKSVEG